MSIALIITLVSFEERCIATFPIKTNLLRGEQESKKSDSLKITVYMIMIHDEKTDAKLPVIHYTHLCLTESTPHLVPVITRPGSRVSPCVSSSTCPALYTCVPIHWIVMVPWFTVVSMRTALFSVGLEADVKHWIFPHLASLKDIIK